jgi:hypothetical protein
VFAVVGVGVVLGCAAAAHARLGWLAWGIYLGGLSALASAFLPRRRDQSVAERELEDLRRAIEREQAEVRRRRTELDALKESAEAALEKQGQLIDQREKQLAQKLIAYHEWLEFPHLVDDELAESQDRHAAELTKKDRQVLELLDAEAKRVYEDIRTNKYSPEGTFDPRILREDIDRLAISVARIYRPESDNPLLETSIDQLLRALGRTSLHLLVVLDRLPLGVKDYNFNSLYKYMRQAIKAYGAYKAAEPYIPYLNGAYYLSRFAMGASPWTLAAWRVVTEISTRGAKKVAAHWFNRQAASIVYDMVRVIGFEVAGIYGGDFRHRDASWIYGAELTDLVSRFPLSRDALSHGLKEIASLRLRNEYDRLFLYQCLAAHATARPERYRPAVYLTAAERRAIAQRLEKFFHAFIHGKTEERTTLWREEVEQRLAVKLSLEAPGASASVETQRRDAIRSLASFLLAVKEREPHELPELLLLARLYRERAEDQRDRLLEELRENPPFFFEQPDLEPEGETAQVFLDDLARLTVRVPPFDVPSDEVLEDVALYLRSDAKEFQRNIDAKREALLRERLQNPPVGKLTSGGVRAVLQQLGPEERPLFLYGDARLEWPRGWRRGAYPHGELWLLGCDDRVLLVNVSAANESEVFWSGGSDVSFRRLKGYISDDVFLAGGDWALEQAPHPEGIRLAGQMGHKWETHFRPLLEFCRQPPQTQGAG